MIGREAAEEQLAARVAMGRTLQQKPVRNSAQLAAARALFQSWSAFNVELLVRLFSDAAMAVEYESRSAGGANALNPTLREEIDAFYRMVAERINRLESIRERLTLVPGDPALAGRAAMPATTRAAGMPSAEVFIVHGHDQAPRETVARFLEKLGLQPVILHERPNQGRTILEKFEAHSKVSFAVVLLTPDDTCVSATQPRKRSKRARQNVIFELGYFFAALGRERVAALYVEGVELPSDVSGLTYLRLDGTDGWKLPLATELHAAGLPVDLNRVVSR
jgi:predicted nucleotide-binding protein